MTNFSNTIRQTYFEHLDGLDQSHTLHFLSRLQQWSGDEQAQLFLATFVRQTKPKDRAEAKHYLQELLQTPWPLASVNLQELRQPYIQRYPQLYGLELALLQARNWFLIYDLDVREAFRELLNKTNCRNLIDSLVRDQPALLALSTYAVNSIYLWNWLQAPLDRKAPLPFDIFIYQSTLATQPESEQLTALIYYATHCIIADSIFYARPVAAANLQAYKKMLAEFENVTSERITQLSLDVSLEFVVAARLCDYQSPLLARIIEYAESHFDPQAGYIIDPLKPNKNDLNAAEHRNVLYLMATTQLQARLAK